MRLKEFNKMINLFEECDIAPWQSGVLLLDKKHEVFGNINFYTNTFTLYEDYSNADKVEAKLKEQGIELFDKALQREIIERIHKTNERTKTTCIYH